MAITAHAPQPKRSFTECGAALVLLLFSPPRQVRPARVAPRHAECREGEVEAFRAPGYPGCPVAPCGRSPDNPRGIIVSRALWLARTRACRMRAAARMLAVHAAGKSGYEVSQPRARRAVFIVFRPASSLRRALDIKFLYHPVSTALFLRLSSRPRTANDHVKVTPFRA
jgi:hypothetical protein